MRIRTLPAAALCLAIAAPARAQSPVDSSLAAFIATIKGVDNHTHVTSLAAADSEFDALPLDGLPPFPSQVRIRLDNPEITAALKSIFGYPWNDLDSAH